jgi:hypothetical protein
MASDHDTKKPSLWAEHLAYLNKSILAQIERIRKGSRHSTITGSSIENILRRTLRQYFPTDLSIGTGQIAACNGDISPQIDILIYDQTTFPLLAIHEDGSVVVCCESVFGCVEVKTAWNHKEIETHYGRFCEIDDKRHPDFMVKSSEDAASYSVVCVEKVNDWEKEWSCLSDRGRKVCIAPLEGSKFWVSDWGEDEFREISTENPLEDLFRELLGDCMRKNFLERGSHHKTYGAVRAYFGWKSME